MLLQRQQTIASETFETLCGHFFLSQRLKRTVVGGKEKKKEPFATHNTDLIYVDENGRVGRGFEGEVVVSIGLRRNFKALIESLLQLLRLIVAVVRISVA